MACQKTAVAFRCFVKVSGLETYWRSTPTDAEIDAWKQASASVYDDFRAKTGDLGVAILKAAEGL